MTPRLSDLAELHGVPLPLVTVLHRELRLPETDLLAPLSAESASRLNAEICRRWVPRPNAAVTTAGFARFKAFADEQSVPLAPLVLLFGPNSAGKSSFLHGLLYLHHVHTTGQTDVVRPALGGNSVDLGGLPQFVFRRGDTGLQMMLELGAIPTENGEFTSMTLRWTVHSPGSALSPSWLGVDSDGERIMHGISALDVELAGHNLLRLGQTSEREWRLQRFNSQHPELQRTLRDWVFSSTYREDVNDEGLAAVRRLIDLLVPLLRFEGSGLVPTTVSLISDEAPETGSLLNPLRDGITKASLPSLVGRYLRIASQRVEAHLQSLRYLGPLRSYPERFFGANEAHDANWSAGGGDAWEQLMRGKEVRERVNEFLGRKLLHTPYRFVSRQLVDVIDAAPEIEAAFHDVNNLLAGEVEEDAVNTLTRIQGSGAIDADDHGSRLVTSLTQSESLTRVFDLKLIDLRTDTSVSHRDVGVGISQIVPVLVHAFADREKTVLIEQPELHVHPAVQAELGDIFVQSALGENRNRFVIETHSEHLILRILKRIRQTTDSEADYPPGLPKIRPEDVAVIYAEPTKQGTKLHRLRITPDGDFADRWPNGFFTERGAELFT